jgi:hypothetical protein
VADNDVVPIVDVGGDTTKKITIESLKSATALANDFVTFTLLNANINVVQDNVASLSTEDTALQARIDANALVAASNDFITFTQLNANINLVQDNVASISVDTASGTEARLNANLDIVQDNVASIDANVVSIVDTGGHTVTFSANLIPSVDGTYDLGSSSAKWKDLYLTGNSIKLGGITISDLGGEGISITGTSGEQANVVTPQLGGAANVSANIATLEANTASTDTRLGANITLLTNEDTALQSRLATNVTAFTNEDTALQARIDANALVAASNDFITFTRLQANIDLVQDNVASISVDTASGTEARLDANLDIVQDNVAAVEARRVANVTIMTDEDTALQSRLTTNVTIFTDEDTALQSRLATNVTAFTNEDTALQARIAANTLVSASNDFITFTRLQANIDLVQDNVASITVDTASGTETRLNANLDVVQDNVAAVESRRAANVTILTDEDTALQSRLTTNVTLFTNEDTALQSRLATNVTAFTNEDTALQARIAANTLVAASNDFITFTRLNSNVDVVQDNVAQNATDITALEARRVANIAGAISSVITSDLTASRALVSDGSGKLAVSDVTSTELAHLDGVSSAIQTQLDAKADLSGATFTGQVNMGDDLVVTGNLTINGDTTTANSVNLVVEDRIMMLANSVTGAPSADVGILFNRGNQGNAALFYDESDSTFKLSDTQDPASNTALSPVSASNLDVGILTAATVNQNGATLDDLISSNVDGAISSVNDTNLTASRALASDGSGKIVVSDVTSTELGYLDGVTSAIQTQLNAKQATITGAATTIDDTDLTASRALASDGSGKVAVSAVTSTELGYLDGVSSAIQTQLDAKSTTSNAAALAAEDVALQARITANSTTTTAVETRRVANIAGAVSTITTGNLATSRAIVSDGSGKVAVSAVTSTEIGYLDGVTSAIQTQLNGKQATITGGATTIDTENLTASRALVSDGSGKVAVSAVTSTEIGYLDGVTSAIQTQLNAKLESVSSGDIDADAITGAKIADNAINSEHYTDGSIDRVHLAADIIDGTKIANDVLNSEHYVAGSIDAEHIASSAVTTAKINDNAVTVGKLATTLDLGAL